MSKTGSYSGERPMLHSYTLNKDILVSSLQIHSMGM